jgi:hypothetical protein
MTRRHIASFVAVAVITIGLAATAVAQGSGIVVRIPYAFVVGEKTFPAGQYTIRHATPNDVHTLVIQGTGRSFAITAIPDEETTPSEHHKLTFKRYGDQYFLKSIHASGERKVYRFAMSDLEEEARSRTGKGENVTLRASVGR